VKVTPIIGIVSICLLSLSASIASTRELSSRHGKVAATGQTGIASHYSYSNGRTASGERLNPGALTAAHRTLPFGTLVRVTHRRNGRSVVVRINDRGPFVRGRVIDVTPAAARALGFSGLAPVSVAVVGG
jgi:rare lipoprotein A